MSPSRISSMYPCLPLEREHSANKPVYPLLSYSKLPHALRHTLTIPWGHIEMGNHEKSGAAGADSN